MFTAVLIALIIQTSINYFTQLRTSFKCSLEIHFDQNFIKAFSNVFPMIDYTYENFVRLVSI